VPRVRTFEGDGHLPPGEQGGRLNGRHGFSSRTVREPGTVELRWHGPFAWPGTGAMALPDLDTAAVAASCGVYLWTVDYGGGFLVYAAGETRRPFRKRFREHTREYRSGRYTVFDAAAMRRGERRKVWPGFWFSKRRPPQLERTYSERSGEIAKALEGVAQVPRYALMHCGVGVAFCPGRALSRERRSSRRFHCGGSWR
jgi:hypothetical protein